ncbi:MAG: carboxypeptidase-like regulatory domain-containing protein [Acidobacteriota bacterium]
MSKSKIQTFAAFSLMLLIVGLGYGQTKTGRVEGTVFDPNGAVIPGAKVTFENAQFSQVTFTNEAGHYEIELPEDVYTLKILANGFLPLEIILIRVEVGKNNIENLILKLEPRSYMHPPITGEHQDIIPSERIIIPRIEKSGDLVNVADIKGRKSNREDTKIKKRKPKGH